MRQFQHGDPISIYPIDKKVPFQNRIETNKIMEGHIRTAIKQNAPTIRSIAYPISLNRPRSPVFDVVVVVDSFHVRGEGEKRKIFKLQIH